MEGCIVQVYARRRASRKLAHRLPARKRTDCAPRIMWIVGHCCGLNRWGMRDAKTVGCAQQHSTTRSYVLDRPLQARRGLAGLEGSCRSPHRSSSQKERPRLRGAQCGRNIRPRIIDLAAGVGRSLQLAAPGSTPPGNWQSHITIPPQLVPPPHP